jgi:hypothetical protein
MPKFKLSELAEPYRNATPPATWQKYSGKRPVDYDRIAAEQARPTLFSDPSAWWASLNDDQKQEALDTLGELAGGTIGAVAGGGTPASIPGAAAGAVAGRAASRYGGKALGLKTKPLTAAEELKETAKTAVLNAGGEAVGAGLALAKPLVKRGLQRVVKPNLRVAQLAEQTGVESMTPGMLSQRPIVKMGEAFIENTPGGMGTIRAKTNEAVKANEANLRKIPERFNPNPVDRPEAGEALQRQLSENKGAMSAEFKPKYQQITKMAGEAPVDLTGFRQSARDFIEDLPAHLESYFPAKTLRELKQTAGMVDGQWAQGGLIDGAAPVMTFAEAQKLRTALLEAERAMTPKDAAVTRKAIPGLRDALDRSIDDSLSSSPNQIHQQALQDWRKLNVQYGETSRKLSDPGGKVKGNPTADIIARADNPDNLVTRIANSPTAVREAEVATTPMFGAPDENAMGKVRRQQLDNLIDQSRTQHRWNQNERIVNPDTLERKLTAKDGLEELTAPVSLEIKENIDVGKAIVGPSKLTNTSGTSRFSDAMRYGTAAGGALTGAVSGDGDLTERSTNALLGGVAGGVALPYAAAKMWTSPRFVKAITKPPGALKAPVMEPLLGASSRGIMNMARLPEAPISLEQAETPKPQTVRFKITDFQ